MQPPCGIRSKSDWPCNSVPIYAWRQSQIETLKTNDFLRVGALEYYRTRPIEFINHWVDTYDPRNAGTNIPTRIPLQMFQRQVELVEFLEACRTGEGSGLIEKARDMGATWVSAAYSVWAWRFLPGAAIGWGSRKEQLVDKLGDPDSIFEKIRFIINSIPGLFWPPHFKPSIHMSYMRIVNPDTGATITGEAGDNIGRGGRKLMYFKDESAHYERPELIEAALGDNTRVQIDISSVNGLGNVFHRRREQAKEWKPGDDVSITRANLFVMDWRDHPAKDQAWYDGRKEKAESDGLLHVFAQEVDRNYSASVEGVIIPAEWVEAAVDAHLKLGWDDLGVWGSALDVADGGLDRNAQVHRKGPVLRFTDIWSARDTAITTRRAVSNCEAIAPVNMQYDCIGVGAGVKAEANRLADDDLLVDGLIMTPWNAAAAVLEPEEHIDPNDNRTPLNGVFYSNLKAQAWWQLRLRFERTFRAITTGVRFDPETMISISSDIDNLATLKKELSQATISKSSNMKLVVDKSPQGTRSPNLADCVVMAYWPADQGAYDDTMNWVGEKP